MLMQVKRIFAVTVLILSVIVSLIYAFSLSLVNCETDILMTDNSPNNSFTVTLFSRDCGATVDYATLISIRRQGEDFDPEPEQSIFIMNGSDAVKVRWDGNSRLEIFFPNTGTVFKKEEKWENISISYIVPARK